MRLALARHGQPQSRVQIRRALRKYLRAGVIASTKQSFGGPLTAIGKDVVSRGGVARAAGSISTAFDSIAYPSLTAADKNLQMVTVGRVVGWDHTGSGHAVVNPVSSWQGCSLYSKYAAPDRYLEARHKSASGTLHVIQHPTAIEPGKIYDVLVHWLPGVELAIYIDDIRAAVATGDTGSYGTTNYNRLGNFGSGSNTYPYLFMFFFAGLKNITEMRQSPLRALFEPQLLNFNVSGVAAALAGDATSTSQTTGLLTTQIPLTGASIVVATATGAISVQASLSGAAASISLSTGDLSTGIDLSGDATGQSTTTADLTATITLSGAAITQALANAGIDTSILLSGSASSSADATGNLTAGSGLSGSAIAASTATGSITAQIQLSASAVAEALATGNLDAPINLSGGATSNAGASGELTTQIQMDGAASNVATATGVLAASDIPLAGDASAQVTAAGDLNTAISLDGAALTFIAATGDLTVNLSLSGDAAALVVAGADLTTQIPLSAAAVAQALSAGTLSGGNSTIKRSPQYTVSARGRNYRVAA